MSDMTTVVMPNGLEVEGVPAGTTRAVILDKLVSSGRITDAEFQEWSGKAPAFDPETAMTEFSGPVSASPTSITDALDPATPTNQEASPTPQDVLMSNADIPAGIAGAIGGAKAGIPFGPAGVAVGTIAGGAGGTFGGALLSDYFKGDELDFSGATRDAMISAGFDSATLGAAKAFKPLARALGFEPEELPKLWDKFMGSKKAQDLPVGSPESLRQTQAFLTSQADSPAAGLTAYQTGATNARQNLQEGLGEIGLASSGLYRATTAQNNKVIGEGIQRLIDDTMDSVSGKEMGQEIHGILNEGKKATQTLFNQSMAEVTTRSGRVPINPKFIAGTMRKFIKTYKTSFGSELDDEALSIAKEWMSTLDKIPTMPLEDVIKFQQKMNRQISSMGEFGSTSSTTATAQLADLSSKVRDVTEGLIKDADPQAYEVYKSANAAYKEAIDGMLPKLNAGTIKLADKGDFDAIARVLEGKNPDKIAAFMNSLDVANLQLGRVGDLGGASQAQYVAELSKKAKKGIRSGWLQNLFTANADVGFNAKTYSKLAEMYEKPANTRAAKAILGEDYPQFKMLINAMAESTKEQTGVIGSLVLRGKEAQAIGGAVQGGAAVLAGGSGVGIPAAAGILLTPYFLAKITSSRAAVNKLLYGLKEVKLINKGSASTAAKTSAAGDVLAQTLGDVMGLLPEDDQAEIRNSFR